MGSNDVKQSSPVADHEAATDTSKNADLASDFTKRMSVVDEVEPEADVRRVRRKVDRTIVPIMFFCYTIQFVDKISLNYARVMGMNGDLDLKGNDFTNAATAFFVAYLVAEIPTGMFHTASLKN